ncbi:MAG: hypothetical protein PHH28_06705 [Desulfuromonadaceae bacterium]|nr:hypothetical protein [Desulfuromonadaceae bacterium]
MDLFVLILYAGTNLLMILSAFFRKEGGIYQFPFWAGVIGLGWFAPQALGGYLKLSVYPEASYTACMLFAWMCTVALWFGFERSKRKLCSQKSWLTMKFSQKRLFLACVVLCLIGFYFKWKLVSLPEEMITTTGFGQWTGVPVKYLFLSEVFTVGFLGMWIQYLRNGQWLDYRRLMFIIFCFVLLLMPVIFGGRRADAMNIISYCFIMLWLVRRIEVHRLIVAGVLVFGIIWVNTIGQYRSVMVGQKYEKTVVERIDEVLELDFIGLYKGTILQAGPEFENFLYGMYAMQSSLTFDAGFGHWNDFVFNYVPAQLVGRSFKDSCIIPIRAYYQIARDKLGWYGISGATHTGYLDSFYSFFWLGWIKFLLIGWLMGWLYRYAMCRSFLAQLLYCYMLTKAMHAISHTTNDVLIRMWVYFFLLGFPMLYWAKSKPLNSLRPGRRSLIKLLNGISATTYVHKSAQRGPGPGK